MESDVHDSKPECFIIDRKEDISNANGMAESQNSVNYSPVTCNGSNNNNQDKKCGYCSATFASQQDLISHLKIHTFICIECDQTFFDDKALASHMAKHMSKKKWVCEFCNKVFSFRSLLEQHSRSHLGLKPFKCDKCGKHFSRLFNMQVHKRQHLAHGSFDCSHCSQKFSHSSNLSKHLRRAHASQTTHKCTQCPKDFPDLWSLNQHLNSHKAPEGARTQNSHSCKFCQLSFTTVNELNQHLQTHANKVNLPSKTYANFNSHTVHLQPRNKKEQFQCEICSKSFLKLADLTCHLKSHSETDETEYVCRLCSNQKFTSAKLLLEHQKSRHNGKLPFVCEYCHKEFMFRSLLTQHLRKHTGEKPFCCPHCKKSFVRLSNMKTHLNRHRSENRLSEEEMIGLASIAIFEQQKETECNSLGWDESLSFENGSSLGKNSQEINSVQSIPTLTVYQNASDEKEGKNQAVTFGNLSLDQHGIPYDIYFSDTVNQTASQYQEEIPPISPLASPGGMYTNEITDEKENDNRATFQNVPLQCDSILFSDIENQFVSNSQHRVSPTPIKDPAVGITDKETEKHNKDLDISFENLPPGVYGYNLLNNQSVPSDQHKKLLTPLKEVSVIPMTTSSNNDACEDKSIEDSYLINLETDLSSQIDNRDLSTHQPFVNDNYMIVEQISTDAVAANNSRILQYLNSQTQEMNLIKEVDQRNCLLEETTTVNTDVSEISGSELIDLTEEINDTKTNLNFTCSFCRTVFSSSELLNDHMKLHTVTKPFVCGYCQKSFRYSSLLTQHIKVHRQQIGSFRCSQCPKNFSSRNSLVLHQKTHKNAQEKPKKALLNCGDCGQQFYNLQDLCHHRCVPTVNVFTNSYEKSDNVGDTRLEKQPEHLQNKTRKKINSLHTCEYCGKVFRFQSLLTQHLRRHTGEKPFTCPICRRSFARLFNLEVHQKRHMKKAHPSSSPSTVHPLQQIKEVVSDPVPDMIQSFTIAPLEKKSPTVRKKMAKKKKFHRCNFCDRSFVMRNDLVKHQQEHKPFICEFCKKEFRFYSLLVQHLPTHTGEKTYYCQICQKSFARLFNLKTHQKNHCNRNRSKPTVGSFKR